MHLRDVNRRANIYVYEPHTTGIINALRLNAVGPYSGVTRDVRVGAARGVHHTHTHRITHYLPTLCIFLCLQLYNRNHTCSGILKALQWFAPARTTRYANAYLYTLAIALDLKYTSIYWIRAYCYMWLLHVAIIMDIFLLAMEYSFFVYALIFCADRNDAQ